MLNLDKHETGSPSVGKLSLGEFLYRLAKAAPLFLEKRATFLSSLDRGGRKPASHALSEAGR